MRGRAERATRVSCATVVVALVLVLGSAAPGVGFDLDPLPPAGPFIMNLNLGQTVLTTARGPQSWNSLAQLALGRWNVAGVGPGQDHHFFGTTANPTPDSLCGPSGVNQVMFLDGRPGNGVFCGMNFPDGAIGITVTYRSATQRIEADVYVNTCYNVLAAYPGRLMTGAPSVCGDPTIYDLYRILLHEFGHVIGLDHPDEAGQIIPAIMNSTVSNLDDLQADDIAGVHAITWTNPLVEMFVRNLYSSVLGRTPAQSEVDGWIAYLRSNPQGANTIVQGFFHSPEFAHTKRLSIDEYITLLYSAILLRQPAPVEVAGWAPVVVDRIDRILPGFVQSMEFQSVLQTTPQAAVIRRFYQNVLGRTPGTAEVDAWVSALQQPGITWLTVARGFLDSPEYLSGRRTFAERIEVLYQTFLGRTPSTGEVDAWLRVLFDNLAGVESGFTGSPEFLARLASVF